MSGRYSANAAMRLWSDDSTWITHSAVLIALGIVPPHSSPP
jgi:hypothetical protein